MAALLSIALQAQRLIKSQKEGRNRYRCRQNIADRLCQENRKDLVFDKEGQKKDQRNQENDLSEAGHKETYLRLPQGHKALLAADLKARRENSNHIDSHRPYGITVKIRIRGEHPDEKSRTGHLQQPEKDGIDSADKKLGKEGFLHTTSAACTIIVTHDRLSPLANSLQRHQTELTDTGDDGHGADRQVSSISGKTVCKANGKDALRRKHDEGRYSQSQTGKNNPCL